MERIQGTVREFRGTYGWITWYMESGQGARTRQTFVHQSALLMEGYRQLHPGDVVEFELETDDTGRQHAVRVRIIQPAETAA